MRGTMSLKEGFQYWQNITYISGIYSVFHIEGKNAKSSVKYMLCLTANVAFFVD